jgi:hypothetical protein
LSGLQDINLPTTNIKVPHNPKGFNVRGLSLPDIINIVHEYRADALTLFEKFSSEDSVDSDTLYQVLAMAPDLVGLLINLASDGGPSTLETAKKLPVSIQANALEEIAMLTFEAEGGPKKLVETVVRMMGGFTGVSEAVQDSMITSAMSPSK